MSGKLFLNSVECTGGNVLLGFAVGTPVVLSDGDKRRDLPGDLAEYELVVSGDDSCFCVRTIVDRHGRVQKVIASVEPIRDDWYEESEKFSEEQNLEYDLQ